MKKEKPMKVYYVYKTNAGKFKMSDEYCNHVFKIRATSLTAAVKAFNAFKKEQAKDSESE